jgi:hypothetical protein
VAVKKDSNNEQIDANAKSGKPNVLRAKDIVPPYDNESRQKGKGGEIPRFDLAEKIMAEQRKISAIKRKAPGKKPEAQGKEGELESTGYTAEQLSEVSSEQEQIIAEIVARDIQQFCRRNP